MIFGQLEWLDTHQCGASIRRHSTKHLIYESDLSKQKANMNNNVTQQRECVARDFDHTSKKTKTSFVGGLMDGVVVAGKDFNSKAPKSTTAGSGKFEASPKKGVYLV